MTDVLPFSTLLGCTFDKVEQLHDDTIAFTANDGKGFVLYHSQECCECVQVDDIAGDLADLVGAPITLTDEATSDKKPKQPKDQDRYAIWTFYRLATVKGYVTIRFYGESNGYYSDNAKLVELDLDNQYLLS